MTTTIHQCQQHPDERVGDLELQLESSVQAGDDVSLNYLGTALTDGLEQRTLHRNLAINNYSVNLISKILIHGLKTSMCERRLQANGHQRHQQQQLHE